MGFQYKTVNTRTEKGLKRAERMQAAGWKIINVGWDSIQFEREVNRHSDSKRPRR